MRKGELTLPSADGVIGRPNWSSDGELVLLVLMREIWNADHSGPDPHPGVDPHQHVLHLCTAGASERAGPDSVAEARGLEPDQ